MRDLRDTLVIARRELLERVKSKWFLIGTIVGPIAMVAMIVIPALIARASAEGARVEIIDKTGVVAPSLVTGLEALSWKPVIVPPETPEQAERDRIRGNHINGFIVIAADALDGGKIVYRGDNATSQTVNIVLRELTRQIVQAERGKRDAIPAEKLARVLAPIAFESEHTTGETEGASGMATFLIAYALAFILYIVITLYGVGVMRSVVHEKTNRVMELMIAAVKPRALMAGKILGIGGAGLIQISVWLGMGALLLAYRDTVLGAFGVSGGGPALPPLGPLEVTIVLVYFVLGFFFYAAMYAAVGAMVSSEQDTQQVQIPITMLLVIGIMCLQVVSNDPRGSSAATMTMVPLWSPMLMPMRYVLGGATTSEVGISLLLLVIATVVVVRAAAKIYRVGVLMYGKRPSLGELLRWLRY